MSRNHNSLNTRRWAATRRAVFKRDGYRCRRCGQAGRLEAHHVKRLEDGGDPWDLNNILSYCRGCHIDHHKPDNMLPGRRPWRDFVEELTGVLTT